MDTEPERDHIRPAPPPPWSESGGSNSPPPPPPWSATPPDAHRPSGAVGPASSGIGSPPDPEGGPAPWAPSPAGAGSYSSLPPPPAARYRRYPRSGYPGPTRRYRRRPPVAAGWRYVLLALGVVTLGFAWLVGAVLCWVAFFRNRRQGQLPVAPVHWLRWAVAFSVLGLVLVPVFLNAAINGNKPSSGSTGSSAPFTMKTVPLGTPVTVRSDLGVELQMVPASVTAAAINPAPTAGGITTVLLKVCATTESVDPSFAADGLELGTTGSAYLVADTNLIQASGRFGSVLPPGRCATGPVPFSVPASTHVTNVQLPSIDVGATWTLS